MTVVIMEHLKVILILGMLNYYEIGEEHVIDYSRSNYNYKIMAKIRLTSLRKLLLVVTLVSVMYFNVFAVVNEIREQELLVVYQRV